MKTLHLVIDQGQQPIRMDVFLTTKVDHLSRTKAQELIQARLVTQNGQIVTKAGARCIGGATLAIVLPTREEVTLIPQDIPLDILFENDDAIVVNKPAHLVVHPAFGNWDGTLANAILHHLQQTPEPITDLRPGIIHRLDKDTSGVMIIAKSAQAKAELQKQFAGRTTSKTYLALVHGFVKPPSAIIDSPIGRDSRDRKKMAITTAGREARTSYEVLSYYQSATSHGVNSSLLRITLHTGRTHQIRVHFASIGYPVVGDVTYGKADPTLDRQFLHAFQLAIRLPGHKESTQFEAPLTPELKQYLQTLQPAAVD